MLQGMPRRISDYPDAFAGWNLISSFGSIISVVATWLFLYIVYVQLVEGKATTRYPWLTPQYYSDSLQTLLNRSYNSLEWALSSPPKPHAFVSLPLQSGSSDDSYEERLAKMNELSTKVKEQKENVIEREKVNKEHSEMGDTDSKHEEATGLELADWDEYIQQGADAIRILGEYISNF